MNQPLDFIGIGVGPFNLSIAALGSEVTGFNSKFFERKPHFSWHPGMMVPDCHMQTSFLKDLVSAVSPTNPYSFLNYLVKRKKFYRFLTTEQRTVSAKSSPTISTGRLTGWRRSSSAKTSAAWILTTSNANLLSPPSAMSTVPAISA